MTEQIRIDSAPLHCSVCYNMFSEAPEVLPCGHSHCQVCVEQIEGVAIRNAVRSQMGLNQIFIECPLCRTRCPLNRQRVKNYTVEAILTSMSTITNGDDPNNEIIATKNLLIKRMEKNEREVKILFFEQEARIERAFFIGAMFSYFGCGFVSWLFGTLSL